jgi:nucleotide-binding universal stress UspA family protein
MSATGQAATGAAVFASVLAGVDGSPEGREAASQAARLVAGEGKLELVTAVYLIEAGLHGWSEERVSAALEREGGRSLAEAAELVGSRATKRLVSGPPLQALLDRAERVGATLISVGSHDHIRMSEMLIGGVSGPLLHEAHCSVLVARPPTTQCLFPRTIVAGIDGSQGSLDALAVAEYLSLRFDAALRVVLARHGDVDIVHAELRAPDVEIVDDGPVGCLVDAASSADLLVVGSRGLHGLRSFGSVSERVAHKARSSVLVVRPHGRPGA